MVRKKQTRSEKLYRLMIYILPAILFFSYHPLMHFGASESMNFEISLPLIWLVIFDVFSLVLIGRKGRFGKIREKWQWLLFPIFLSLSVLWSIDFLRGLLTVGILWLIYLAVFSFWVLSDVFADKKFSEKICKSLIYSALAICAWCVLQCILDVVGISRDYTLMCAGCTYQTFGFPHPNGFAAEPQFMGNLLLAPAIMAGWLMIQSNWKNTFSIALLFFVFSATLFLTLSRGAIYSFVLAMIFMTVFWIVKAKNRKSLYVWPVIFLAFLFTLNLQGLMAQFSKTNDNYVSGVSKTINQLSLGVIDLGNRKPVEDSKQEQTKSTTPTEKEEAHFDGYVEVSTNKRLEYSKAALSIWSENWQNALFGVGIGGTSNALRMHNYTNKKEIVNNQYVNLLLETGVVGIALMVFSLVLAVRGVMRNERKLPIMTLIIAYAASLLFFSGLPNALHIYLLPAILLYGKS